VSGLARSELPAPEPVAIADRNEPDDVAIAVVGCGVHSTTAILPSLRHARGRLVAVCDLDVERAEFARRRFGAEAAYGSLDEVLARTDLDAVIVVGPPALHVHAGIAALGAGRHVFVEKPPGQSLKDAISLRDAARAAGRQLMVGFNKRRASAYRLAAQLIAAPEFGEVTSVELTYSSFPISGLRLHLTDMSIHALDTVRWLAGEPVRIACFKRDKGDNHVLALTVEHESGIVSRLELSAFAPGLRERLAVTGEGAAVQVDGPARLTYSVQADGLSAEETNTRVTRCWAPEMSLPDKQNDAQVVQGYATELIAFCDAVREGRDVTPSIDDGVAAMRMIEAIAAAPDGTSVVELRAEHV
jgi:myo-inositol 2-dehydrogenase / D-chiro-inositol 1-dehydrogenase